MKLVGETFSFGNNGIFAYLHEVHTSVLGIREFAEKQLADVKCLTEDQLKDGNIPYCSLDSEKKLIAFPAQCNFSGKKYDLDLVTRWQKNGWRVLLDAASFVATSPLDLSSVHPDFIVLSFYKMFGFPTGLGALLVQRNAQADLNKIYFGGGTVELTIGGTGFRADRKDFVQK